MSAVGEAFPGNRRFSVLRRLGSGGMGVVYEAVDREHETRVAIKTLRQLTPRSLSLFKNEFRGLQDVRHPNLVSLGDLFEHEGYWFFTMELVDGCDFMSWVRPGLVRAEGTPDSATADVLTPVTPSQGEMGQLDVGRLRASLVQLASGLAALHAAGKVHRDIKPSNIRVTPAGRLVVLDFGLVSDVVDTRDSLVSHVVGTSAYMAPEQAASGRVGPEADWYSVGVVLYEALAARLPFTGSALQVLMAKQQAVPPSPATLARGVPEDLAGLALALLRFDSGARPGGSDVLRLAGQKRADSVTPVPTPASSFGGMSPFVGRKAELELLAAAFRDSQAGRAVQVVVRGDSGMGKTSLVKHFVERQRAFAADLLLLAGRCHEREAVPYKAFDGAIEDLTRRLKRLDDVGAALLLGEEGPLIARLFPALARVNAVGRALSSRDDVPNPQQQRTRAFAALRRVLTRLAGETPVILTIDDAQWADADSVALLAELWREPGAPPVLTLITARPGASPIDAVLAGLPDVRTLPLAGLDVGDGAALARVLGERLAARGLDGEGLARESQGHPMFLQELVHHAANHGGHEGPARLDDVLAGRLARLEPPAQRLLEVLAVAAAPLPPRIAVLASGLEAGEASRQLAVLRVAMFARTTTTKGREAVEPYHDRIRRVVLARLGDAREQHGHIAEALEAEPSLADAHLLVLHLSAAGERARAARQAEVAAGAAAGALAFEQAAELYRVTLELGERSEAERRRLLGLWAEALVNAGRCPEAAAIYDQLAEGATPGARFEYLRRSAEQLLISGHVDQGLGRIRAVFAQVGLRFPETPRQVVLDLLRHRLAIRLRGITFQARDAESVSGRELEQLEFHKTVSIGLSAVDPPRASVMAARGLRIAFRAGQRTHVGRFLALDASFVASSGRKARERALHLLAQVQRIAEQSDDAYLRAVYQAGAGNVEFLTGDFAASVPHYKEAEALLRDRTTGTTWEMNGTRTFLLHALRHIGACRELGERLDEYLRDAIRRGDRYAETTMCRTSNIVWLVRGDVERARRELSGDKWSPPETGFLHLQHWYELRAQAEIELFVGDVRGLGARLAGRFAAIRASLLHRLQTVRTDLTWMAGRVALAEGDLGEALRCARRLEGEGVAYAQAWAALLRAGAAGDPRAAVAAFRRAHTLATSARLALAAAVSHVRLGGLLGGDAGAKLVEDARAWLRGEGVVDVDAVARIVEPGPLSAR